MKGDKDKQKVLYTLSIAFQLGLSIVIPLAIAILIGIKLDEKMKTSPLFLLIFVLIGFLFIIFETYYFLLPIIKKKK